MLQELWNRPEVRKGVGTAAYGGAILLIAGAATALILHFTTGEILGMKIPITYPVMLASFSSLAVLKGLQYREEATLIRKQNKTTPGDPTAPEKTEPVIRPLTDSKHEKIWKGVALIGGVAMIALFSYQLARFFNGGGSRALQMRAVSLVPAVGVLSYSVALVNQFLGNRKRNGKTAPIKKPRKLKERLARLAPNRFSKVTIVGGGLIVLTALAALIARYGFGVKGISLAGSYTPLSLSNIAKLGLTGALVSGSGAMAIGFGRKEKDIAAQDERIATLRKRVEKLEIEETEEKLVTLEERRAIVKKAVGTLAIAAGIILFAIQLWGFDSASFRRIFGAAIKTDLLSFAMVLTTAAGMVGGGVALIKNADEHRQDIEEAALERALKKAD